MLLAHQLVDLIIQISDLEVRERGILDLRHFARDFFEHLAAPFLACWDRVDGGYEFGAPGS